MISNNQLPLVMHIMLNSSGPFSWMKNTLKNIYVKDLKITFITFIVYSIFKSLTPTCELLVRETILSIAHLQIYSYFFCTF